MSEINVSKLKVGPGRQEYRKFAKRFWTLRCFLAGCTVAALLMANNVHAHPTYCQLLWLKEFVVACVFRRG